MRGRGEGKEEEEGGQGGEGEGFKGKKTEGKSCPPTVISKSRRAYATTVS